MNIFKRKKKYYVYCTVYANDGSVTEETNATQEGYGFFDSKLFIEFIKNDFREKKNKDVTVIIKNIMRIY